jgi:ribosomal protein L23
MKSKSYTFHLSQEATKARIRQIRPAWNVNGKSVRVMLLAMNEWKPTSAIMIPVISTTRNDVNVSLPEVAVLIFADLSTELIEMGDT